MAAHPAKSTLKMTQKIVQLFPDHKPNLDLKGLYLNHNIRQLSQGMDTPFVYANYICSLDGRISILHPSGQGQMVPKATANERDWRLFQELAAQADLIISSGRYLRDREDGRAQEILDVSNPEFADLRAWRERQGLKPQPDIAIISGSLDFPIPSILTTHGRQLLIFTTADAPQSQIEKIKSQTDQVFIVGEQSVDGRQMMERIKKLGYQTVYNATGPKVMHLLLKANAVNRLYLTFANRILGGHPFTTIVEGNLFETAVNLTLNAIYLDPTALDGMGQLFNVYNVHS